MPNNEALNTYPSTLATEATAITYSGFEGIEGKEFYARNVLQPLREEHILDQFFEKITMPKNHGKTYSYRKFGRIKTPEDMIENGLSEGVLPDPNTMGMTEYRFQVQSFGDWIKYTDEAKIFSIDDIVGQLTVEMGYSFKDFLDVKRVEGLATTKNVWYAGTTGTNQTAPTGKGINLEDLNKIHAFFRRNNVKPGADGTYPVIVPPEAIIPLKSLTKTADGGKYTYVEILQGQQSKLIYEGADGKVLGFTFVVSNSIKVEGTTNKTANCYILGKVRGKWGIAEVNVEAEGKELIHKPLSSGGVDNALNQVGSVGWKLHGYGVAVTADEAVVRYVIALDDNYTEWEDAQRSNVQTTAVVDGEAGTITPVTSTNGNVTTTSSGS